jgi:hypothetical protein
MILTMACLLLIAALHDRYRPRVIDGTPIEVAGVRDRVEFRLQQND